MSFLSLLIYLPLQIAFIPLALIGAVLVAIRQILISKRLGVSQTAIEIINGRWTMHVFGIRSDEATARLAGVLSNTSVFGLWLCLFPLWLKHKLSGEIFLYPLVPEPGSETVAGLGFSLDFSGDFEGALSELAAGESFSVGETFFLGSASDKGPYMAVAELICR